MVTYLLALWFQWGNPVIENFFDLWWKFSLYPVQSFGHSVGEETILSKQSLNCWFKAFSLHTNLWKNIRDCFIQIIFLNNFFFTSYGQPQHIPPRYQNCSQKPSGLFLTGPPLAADCLDRK